MFIDTHTHLFVEQFDNDRTAVVEKAIAAGVEHLLLPNIDVNTIEAMNELVKAFPNNCAAMMGLHPSSVKEDWEEQLAVIQHELFTKKYIAVGEIGIDLYWDKTFLAEQQEAFKRQVMWAKELNIPIAIHAREAFDEIFEIVDELNDERLTGVFHCFTGTKEQAEKIMSYGGFKMGIGGVVTYKKAELDQVLVNVPLSELILETDSPYLSPVPFRGKRNESSYLLHIAEKLADIYNVSLKEVEEQTTSSAKRLFKIDQSLNQKKRMEETKPKVLIIYTGGTIGMIKDIDTGQLISFNFDHLYDHLPELKRINVEMNTISFEKPIDSSEINPTHWELIAETIYAHYSDYDGFVVLHGSDTMAYTASALSFMFEGLKKPIIITGSQLPIGIIRTDGKENLITSIEIAAAKIHGEPIVQEVAIYFEYHLYRGNRSTKYSATNFEAIQSPNYVELAAAGVEIEYNEAKLFRDKNSAIKLNTATNSKVALIKLFPGIDFNIYRELFNRSNVDGIILETFGAGNAPSNELLKSLCSAFIADGGVILNITQCSSGGVKQGLYETSAVFNEIGVLSGYDLTTEAAVTKMMVALAANTRSETISMLQADLRGEVTLS